MERDDQDQDCAICLQKCHHPTQLPCGHIFCFLCVKGIAILSKKCAICRTQIPPDYLDNPVLLDNLNAEEITEPENEKYHWYYEGRNGWWKYDERSNIDLENAYSSNETQCLLLLAGTLYCVDIQNMVQFRRSDPTKRRHVKRDVPTLPSKGIAGIKNIDSRQIDNLENTSDVNTNNTEIRDNESEIAAVTDVVIDDNVQDVTTMAVQPVHTTDDLTVTLSLLDLQEDLSRSADEIPLQNTPEDM